MKKTLQTLSLAAALFAAPGALAQAHVHDQGEILIMQQGSMWNIQFIIPAVNAFGFEHAPETKAQYQAMQSFVDTIKKADNVLFLNSSCELLEMKENLSDNYLKKPAGKHHGHDKGHGHHKEHGRKAHHDHGHLDVKLEYTFNCMSRLSDLKVNIFNQLKGLHGFSAQWITNHGQGAQKLNSTQPKLTFNQ